MTHEKTNPPTIGSLFAGIGGFDLGFEQAGWHTRWQVEIDPTCRAVLAHRFPAAERHADIRDFHPGEKDRVDCIIGGFPCQDISNAGAGRKAGRLGLSGARSGLFFEAMRVIREIQPPWLVLENVEALRYSNQGRDLATVLRSLRDSGYVGLWRVLDAQHFGSPSRRRRLFLVAGHHRHPPMDLLADAAPVEAVSSTVPQESQPLPPDAWPGHTLQAFNTPCRISLGCELLVAEENGWSQMDDRARESDRNGFCLGLDEASTAEKKGAGNAVHPAVAKWIADKLIKEL